ncbi:hypothetical protein [Candidatus Pantoea floridensis]|uniref:Uncharacterized protein n=1 Tax=Candidatus Pantoea floridensis TaxID=1938870 RepID=A0A286DSD4_9GAMM|nr:hypothetical protein [Pantoea floridensis]PIF06921.1 hypothetical protein BX596_5221 [Enterobacteriaceae bacterium JKS000233]SOD61559.1 hypothetical protein SAMN06273570_5198 [Pantoea floridensis]
MRNNKREEIMIRLITLLDDAELGERGDTILHLLHSARQASRARDFMAGQHCLDALSQLRKARHSLRVAGASEQVLTPLEYAVELLLPVCEDALSDQRALTFAHSQVWRVLVLLFLLPAGLALTVTAVVWSTRQLLQL